MTQRIKNIAANVLIWGAILAYTVFALGRCSERSRGLVCTGIRIEIRDSLKLGFITPSIVKNAIIGENIKVTGEKLSSINTRRIEKLLLSRGYVKSAEVYTSIDGKLNISIEQRVPKMRIESDNGYSVYICRDNFVVPVQSYFHADVPIITGIPQLPFPVDFTGPLLSRERGEKKYGKSYSFLYNLINFVEFLGGDPFWGAQVVQINVLAGGDVELVQRVGDYIVNIGGLEDYREKLDKLMVFYRKGLPYEGWNRYKYINIAYKNEIFCTERSAAR